VAARLEEWRSQQEAAGRELMPQWEWLGMIKSYIVDAVPF